MSNYDIITGSILCIVFHTEYLIGGEILMMYYWKYFIKQHCEYCEDFDALFGVSD